MRTGTDTRFHVGQGVVVLPMNGAIGVVLARHSDKKNEMGHYILRDTRDELGNYLVKVSGGVDPIVVLAHQSELLAV